MNLNVSNDTNQDTCNQGSLYDCSSVIGHCLFCLEATSSTEVNLQESLKRYPHVLSRFCVANSRWKVVALNCGDRRTCHLLKVSKCWWKLHWISDILCINCGHQGCDRLGKEPALLHDFTIMYVYNYLIHSQEKEFGRKSLKAYKSRKHKSIGKMVMLQNCLWLSLIFSYWLRKIIRNLLLPSDMCHQSGASYHYLLQTFS